MPSRVAVRRSDPGAALRASALPPEVLNWTWRGTSVDVAITRAGRGPRIVLLPALSSISTRHEMAPLQARLARSYETVAFDWPGFGDRARPRTDWSADAYRAFLHHGLSDIAPRPFATVAAGHAGGYLIDAAARSEGLAGRLCLVAPTWRGPLPTMMGDAHALGRRLVGLGDMPGFGALLYRLNVNRFMVRLMAREHVYDDPAWFDEGRAALKVRVTSAPGARYAALRFVTGQLDPMTSRAEILAAAGRVRMPMLVVYGRATPARSKAEMEALATLPGIEAHGLPFGKLGLHEEYPDAVADLVLPFLARHGAPAGVV